MDSKELQEMLADRLAGEAEPALVPTGCLSLDSALGGGWPAGKISRISGPPATGKSTLLYGSIAAAQKHGLTVALVRFYDDLDMDYAETLGVDTGNLVLGNISSVVQAAALSRALRDIPFVAVDCAGSQAQAEDISLFGDSGRTVVGVTQQRMRLPRRGISRGGTHTHPIPSEAVTVQLRAVQPVLGGVRVHAESWSLKHWPPSAVSWSAWDLVFGRGIDHAASLVDLGTAEGVLTRRGNHYSYGELRLGNGRQAAAAYLRADGQHAAMIEQDIRKDLGITGVTGQ